MDFAVTPIKKWAFPSGKDCCRMNIEKIFHAVSDLPYSCDIGKDDLYLVIDEAVTNAMEHGNKWDSGKMLAAGLSRSGDRVFITITDEGDGFAKAVIEEGMHARSILSRRGRGIGIISHLCDVDWNESGNTVRLSFRICGENQN